jgi:hypothetical protein
MTDLQSETLNALREHGSWPDYNDARIPWIWKHTWMTRRVLIALTAMGYVRVEQEDGVDVYYPEEVYELCPFCGSGGAKMKLDDDAYTTIWSGIVYGCEHCGIYFDTAKQWNKRK